MVHTCVVTSVWPCDPMDCSKPGSSVHGILQARILELGATSFSRGSSRPRDWICGSYGSCVDRQILYHYVPPGKPTRRESGWKINESVNITAGENKTVSGSPSSEKLCRRHESISSESLLFLPWALCSSRRRGNSWSMIPFLMQNIKMKRQMCFCRQ